MDLTIDQLIQQNVGPVKPKFVFSNLTLTGKALLVPALIGAGAVVLINSFTSTLSPGGFLFGAYDMLHPIQRLTTDTGLLVYRDRIFENFHTILVDQLKVTFIVGASGKRYGEYSVTNLDCPHDIVISDDGNLTLNDFMPIRIRNNVKSSCN